MPKKKSEHYVNNKELLEAMVNYRARVEKSYKKNFNKDLTEQPKQERAKQWEGKPPIPNYLGECFLKIATHLSYKPNFVNYMFREDMISDGIENCVQYIHNFDPEKSKNPFAYFTQIIYYAFIRRIQKEKKQLYVKYKTMDSFSTLGENTEISEHDGETQYVYDTMNADQKANMYDFISNFEEAKKKKSVSKKKNPTNLEYFMVA